MPNRAGPNDFGLQAGPNLGLPKSHLWRTTHCDTRARSSSGAVVRRAVDAILAARTTMPRHDPRDALGDLLVDAVVPVLGWPAFYKCAALSRSWHTTLKRVRKELRRRHAPPPPRFGEPLLDLPLFVERVVPFLGWPGLFGCSRVSRGWNAAVEGRARRALRRLLDKTPASFRPDAADVESWERDLRRRGFPEDAERDDDGFPWGRKRWDNRRINCYGPRGVVLPSHVRALLAVCAGASRVKDGYASTAANTFQPLDRWRLVSSVAALRAIQRDLGDDFFEDRRIKSCLIVLRCWRVPMCGECYDIWQMVCLSLFDGLLYYYNSRARGRRRIGTALDYVRGGWQHSWRPEQYGYYHVPGATMIVHSDDPAERQGIVYHEPPPDMDLVLPQRTAREAALTYYGDANHRVGNVYF